MMGNKMPTFMEEPTKKSPLTRKPKMDRPQLKDAIFFDSTMLLWRTSMEEIFGLALDPCPRRVWTFENDKEQQRPALQPGRSSHIRSRQRAAAGRTCLHFISMLELNLIVQRLTGCEPPA